MNEITPFTYWNWFNETDSIKAHSEDTVEAHKEFFWSSVQHRVHLFWSCNDWRGFVMLREWKLMSLILSNRVSLYVYILFSKRPVQPCSWGLFTIGEQMRCAHQIAGAHRQAIDSFSDRKEAILWWPTWINFPRLPLPSIFEIPHFNTALV